MVVKGKVLIATTEDKELVSKEGVRRQSKLNHVVLQCNMNGRVEILNVRAYDAVWPLPELGKEWESPRVRQYLSNDGNVADVSVVSDFSK